MSDDTKPESGEFSADPAPRRDWLPDSEPSDPPSKWREVMESRYVR